MTKIKQYKIIYADPPWQYRDKGNAGKRGADHKYNTMTTKEIAALPIADISKKNAVCFMWITPPFLGEGLAVLESWGFKYKTIGFVWVKVKKMPSMRYCGCYDPPSPIMGMGHYTRANTEIVLIGVRRKGLPRVSASVNSVILEPRRAHSQKPDTVRDRIVELYGDLPRIELFARERAKGWDTWGDQL